MSAPLYSAEAVTDKLLARALSHFGEAPAQS